MVVGWRRSRSWPLPSRSLTAPPAPRRRTATTRRSSPCTAASPACIPARSEPSRSIISTTFAVGGLEHTLAFEPQARILADDSGRPRCTTLALGREALITSEPPGCAGSDCTGGRVRLPALGGLGPFPASTPLYRCTVAAASDAALVMARDSHRPCRRATVERPVYALVYTLAIHRMRR